MVRTQIYLTDKEKRGLKALAKRTGQSQSELIRTAIDALLDKPQALDRRAIMAQARGMWKDRSDLPDFAALRREMDRNIDDADGQ